MFILIYRRYSSLLEKHNNMKERVEKVEDSRDKLTHRVTVLETTKVSTEQMETKINERFRHLEDKIDKNNYQVENKIEKQNEKLDDIKSILIQAHDRRRGNDNN